MAPIRRVENVLRLHRDSLLLSEIWGAIENDQYKRAIELAKQRVDLDTPTTRENRSVKYALAAALDYDGQSMQAFKIFEDLANKYPCYPEYATSTLRCAHDIMVASVRRLDSSDLTEDGIVLGIYDWLRENYFVPAALLEKVCEVLIKQGRGSEAKALARDSLKLYPNDIVFLKLNRELAEKLKDNQWHDEITVRVEGILEDYPFRLDLYGLLPKDQVPGKKH